MRIEEHSAKRALQAGEAARGVLYYHGKPCRLCGSTFRYTMTRACVECVRSKARAKTAAKREARRQRGLRLLKRLGLC